MIAVPTENEINELRYFHCMAWKVLEMEQQARVRQFMRRGWLVVEAPVMLAPCSWRPPC